MAMEGVLNVGWGILRFGCLEVQGTRVIAPVIRFVADLLEMTVMVSAGAAVVVATKDCHGGLVGHVQVGWSRRGLECV